MPTPTSGGLFSYIASSGNSLIDPELGGSRWGDGSKVTTVTYSFPSFNSYWSTDTYSGYGPASGAGEPWNGFNPFNAQGKAAVKTILDMISSYANIKFVETLDSAMTVGDLRFAFSSDGSFDELAHAYRPFGEYGWRSYVGNSASPISGDVWITGKTVSAFSPVAGNYDYMTLIHEIGHALGLKHPHEYEFSERGIFGMLPFSEDVISATLMSYNSIPGYKNANY